MAGFSFDGRFGCGPSKIRLDQLQALSAKNSPIGTSHRRPPVRDLVKEIQDRFRALYNLPEEYEVVLGNGGASAFWDMIVFSLVRSKVSASRFGEFGGKFIKEAQEAPFVEQVFVNEVEVGSAAYPQANLESGVADLFAYPHNETSTGAMLSPKRIWGLDNGQV
ncbi:MAG: phosphoserine transaminase, partial [Candidatus Ancillula sp.]|nr:phosphoserine transaminase [Candidatus Ancillula sp.]